MKSLRCEDCNQIFTTLKGKSNHLRYGGCPALKAKEILENERAYMKEWFKTEKGKKLRKKHADIAYDRHAADQKARRRFRYAVSIGKFNKSAYCEMETISDCIDTKLEAHHYLGYEGDHWKDVKWLCSRHHRIAHDRYIDL